MSGHSKWANIKRKKEANDKVKGAIFAKLSRLITLAVTESGGINDPDHNFKLRLIIDKAKSLNMPKDNVTRAIEKASGGDRVLFKEAVYEGFGPYGSCFLVYATTDNSNRTVSEIKNCLEKHQGKLGSQGSVSYLFQKCGLVEFDVNANTEEDIFDFAQKENAIDIEQFENIYYVFIPFENLGKIKDHPSKVKPIISEVDYRALSPINLLSIEESTEVLKLIEALDDLDDVHKVFSNVNL